MQNAVEQNGVAIVRTPAAVGVSVTRPPAVNAPYTVEVYYLGRLLKSEAMNPFGLLWRDCFEGVDHFRCWLRVKCGETILAELPPPPDDPHPFMVRSIGSQAHVTENYVSVPPALTITAEDGAVFTLGFAVAPREHSPRGEYAFDVLRDGVPAGAVASRIERRGGKVRAFTRAGWKAWSASGREFL